MGDALSEPIIAFALTVNVMTERKMITEIIRGIVSEDFPVSRREAIPLTFIYQTAQQPQISGEGSGILFDVRGRCS